MFEVENRMVVDSEWEDLEMEEEEEDADYWRHADAECDEARLEDH